MEVTITINEDLERRVRDVVTLYKFKSIEEAIVDMVDDVVDVWMHAYEHR